MQWVSKQRRKNLIRYFIRSSCTSFKTSRNLYTWSKDSVSNSVFIGLFCAMLPIPTQMIVAGTAALAMRAHLPLAVALVWLSNPLTFIPLAWTSLCVGCALLGVDRNIIAAAGETSLINLLNTYWLPLLAGSLTLGLLLSITGYWLTRMAWRTFNMARWNFHRRTQTTSVTVAELH